MPILGDGDERGCEVVVAKRSVTWRMLHECGTSEGVWEILLYKGKSALEWEVANGGMPLYSLQRHVHDSDTGHKALCPVSMAPLRR